MILVLQKSDGTLALVVAVRERRPHAPAVIAEDDSGNQVVIRPAVPEETPAEYLADILAAPFAALGAGTTHIGTITHADLPNMIGVQEWARDAAGVPVKRTGNPRIGRNSWAWNGAAVVCPTAAVAAHQLASLRAVRNRLLADSDVDMLRADEQTAPNAAALRAYRQALRDLPASNGDPMAVAWPAKP